MAENEEFDLQMLDDADLAAVKKEIDRQVQQALADREGRGQRMLEQNRKKDLDAQELEELSKLPRGANSLRERTEIQMKYHRLRTGEQPAPYSEEMAQLEASREQYEIKVPDTNNQWELMEAYKKAVAPWRGVVSKVSQVQEAFRARGLKI